MIDLLGFWFMVTLCCVLLFAPLLAVAGRWLGYLAVYQVTQDKQIALKVGRWFAWHNAQDDEFVLFGKTLNEDVGQVFVVVGFLIAIGFLAHSAFQSSVIGITTAELLIRQISTISTACASTVGPFALLVVVYIVSIKLLRRLYQASVKLAKISKKLDLDKE